MYYTLPACTLSSVYIEKYNQVRDRHNRKQAQPT